MPDSKRTPPNVESELLRLERSSVMDGTVGREGELVRMLLAMLPIGVLAYDFDRIYFANASARELLGIDDVDQSGVERMFQHVDPLDWPLLEARRAQRRRGEQTPAVTLRVLHKDGRLRVVTAETLDVPGTAGLMLTILHDVTDRKKAEAERAADGARKLQEAEASIETQKLESLGMLTGGIAHDFNNLLANVYASLEVVSHLVARLPSDAQEPFKPHLTNASSAATRAAELTRQLVAYGGRAELVRRPTSLTELTEDVAPLLRVALSKKTSLTLHLERGLAPVSADPTQIRQILLNLVTNGAEAIGDGAGEVTIRTWSCASLPIGCQAPKGKALVDAPLGWSVLEVADNGRGMAADVRLRVFEPFFSTKGPGRGLGLATTVGILRGHDAALSLESTVRVGTRFVLAFPALAGAALDEAPAEETQPTDARLVARILLVDDEARARFALGFLLKLRGIDVVEAANGHEAIAKIEVDLTGFDVVVMDLSMPRMGGREASAIIHTRWPEVPVILMSGDRAADRVAQPGHQAPVFAFLEKPFREEALFALVSKAVRLRRQGRVGHGIEGFEI